MQEWGSAFKARRSAEESEGEHGANTRARDNEWGYSYRVIGLLRHMKKDTRPSTREDRSCPVTPSGRS